MKSNTCIKPPDVFMNNSKTGIVHSLADSSDHNTAKTRERKKTAMENSEKERDLKVFNKSV